MKTFEQVKPKDELAFPDVEQMKASELINRKFVLKECKERKGKEEGTTFFVCLIELEGKKKSVAFGSKAVNDQIRKTIESVPYEVSLKEVKSKTGRLYQTFV